MTELRTDLSEKIQIIELTDKLATLTSYEDIENVFVNHCKNNVIDKLLSDQLIEISEDSEYSAPNISSKLSLRIINNEKIICAVQLFLPGDVTRHQTIWKGDRQILAVKGSGSLKVRLLQMTAEANIYHYNSSYGLTLVEERIVKGGDIITNGDSQKIIEIVEVYSPVMIESLDVKTPELELYWTFDNNLHPVGVIPSKSFLARLKIIVDLAIEMEQDIPQILYNTIIELGHPHIKFRAIEAMLLEGHPDAEDHFQMALESNDPILSGLAQDLYKKLIANQ